ncbi:hypothetical protein [Thermodesulfobacterium commune]|uniref:Uncharacterized protein n=1 Tax=Thermodesulfobacterium commune DSM 2178 TaxID=289377 RepID=A0A075WUA2_9BACT|nr:hypothetical protein [Thermodesulfobacterium commune]AIH04471.1 hypothetical protein HL41_07060 [Thermodesulfobacterium commune DSM 2178]
MKEEKFLLRGELEEIKDRLSVLYYELKGKTAIFYQKAYDLTNIGIVTYQDEVSEITKLIEEIVSLKKEIKALEERAEYLKRKLKEVQ